MPRRPGPVALDVAWSSDTYSARRIDNNFDATEAHGEHTGVRLLDVSATLDEEAGRVAVYVVNRDLSGPREIEFDFSPAQPGRSVEVHTITGAEPGSANTIEDREQVVTRTEVRDLGSGPSITTTVPALSVTGLIFEL